MSKRNQGIVGDVQEESGNTVGLGVLGSRWMKPNPRAVLGQTRQSPLHPPVVGTARVALVHIQILEHVNVIDEIDVTWRWYAGPDSPRATTAEEEYLPDELVVLPSRPGRSLFQTHDLNEHRAAVSGD